MSQEKDLTKLLSPEYLIKQIRKVHAFIFDYTENRPDLAFKRRTDSVSKKLLLDVDLLAEAQFIEILTKKFGKKNIYVIGEESLANIKNLENETRTIVLIDMIDGTDLFQRGFSNWCSAIAIFQPDKKKIKGAFVAFPYNYLYYAIDGQGAYKRRLSTETKEQEIKPIVPLKDKELKDASVCMYAQKSENLIKLLALNQQQKFVDWLKEMVKVEHENRLNNSTDTVGFRFYNFAGNPMMVRLAEGVVDIVFEPNGQAPHDSVPGLFIAIQSGAALGQLNGECFTLEELSESLLHPDTSQVKYILAANKSLLKEFSDLLN